MLHYNILYVGTVTVEGRSFWLMYMRAMRRSGGIIPRLTAKQVTLNYAMLVFLTNNFSLGKFWKILADDSDSC